MKTVYTAGGMLLQDDKILLVQQGNVFVLPKGHIETGETKENAAVRELLEETGYEVEIIEYCGQLSRPSTEKTGEAVNKVIDIFLMKILRLTQQPTDEKSQWITLANITSCMKYVEEREFVLKYLANKY